MPPSTPSTLTALHTLLRAPTTLRPLLLQQPILRASYHSNQFPPETPYPEPESRILSAALAHVPAHGFTLSALARGARDAGYLDITTNLFPRGAFELVRYHLVTQRLQLRDRAAAIHLPVSAPLNLRVRALVLARLRANLGPETPVLPHWSQALGIMSLAENLPASVGELARLSDEIWYLAGDTAVDGSWYAKRAGLAGVYAAAEIFSTTDRSEGLRDTEEFLDRRLGEVRTLGDAVGGTMEWMGFQGGALVGLLRSKGVRI